MRVLGAPADINFTGYPEDDGLPDDLVSHLLGSIGGGSPFCDVRSLVGCAAEPSLDQAAIGCSTVF